MLETTILITTIATLGMLSPGPDFFLVVKTSLRYDRKTALLTCAGIICALLIHMAYCIAGFALVITSTPWLVSLITYVGSAYLIWIGLQALRSTSAKRIYINDEEKLASVSPNKAFMQGFLCNLLNIKATLFFLAMFSQIIDVNSGVIEKLWYALIIWFLALIWWPLLVYIIQSQYIRTRLLKMLPLIDKLLGCVLIGFGVKVALS